MDLEGVKGEISYTILVIDILRINKYHNFMCVRV